MQNRKAPKPADLNQHAGRSRFMASIGLLCESILLFLWVPSSSVSPFVRVRHVSLFWFISGPKGRFVLLGRSDTKNSTIIHIRCGLKVAIIEHLMIIAGF